MLQFVVRLRGSHVRRRERKAVYSVASNVVVYNGRIKRETRDQEMVGVPHALATDYVEGPARLAPVRPPQVQEAAPCLSTSEPVVLVGVILL